MYILKLDGTESHEIFLYFAKCDFELAAVVSGTDF